MRDLDLRIQREYYDILHDRPDKARSNLDQIQRDFFAELRANRHLPDQVRYDAKLISSAVDWRYSRRRKIRMEAERETMREEMRNWERRQGEYYPLTLEYED